MFPESNVTHNRPNGAEGHGMYPNPSKAQQALIDKTGKPDFSINGVQGWCYTMAEGTVIGGKTMTKDIEMVLLELSTQDGSKRYHAFSRKNCEILAHNASGLVSGLKGLNASLKERAERERLEREVQTAKDKDEAKVKADTLHGVLKRSAIIEAIKAEYPNLTQADVESLVSAT